VQNGILNPDYTPNEATAARLGWKLLEQDEVRIEERWWLPDDERKRLLDQNTTQPMKLPEPPPATATDEKR
jgi:hypothetical protein